MIAIRIGMDGGNRYGGPGGPEEPAGWIQFLIEPRMNVEVTEKPPIDTNDNAMIKTENWTSNNIKDPLHQLQTLDEVEANCTSFPLSLWAKNLRSCYWHNLVSVIWIRYRILVRYRSLPMWPRGKPGLPHGEWLSLPYFLHLQWVTARRKIGMQIWTAFGVRFSEFV